MNKRPGISRADVIVVIVICVIGLSILFPAINQRRALARRAHVLHNMNPPIGAEMGDVWKLERSVTIHAPEKNPPPGLYVATIPVPEGSNPRITGGTLKHALDSRVLRWTMQHSMFVSATQYETDPDLTQLRLLFTVVR